MKSGKRMTIEEKQELVRLLHVYMADLVAANEANMQEAKRHEHSWEGHYVSGVKAQYDHARIIASRLAVEVQGGLKTIWQL